MTRKEDKRKRKTKSAVCNAVMTLLTKKSLDKISIKEISEEADINRATFYLHFNDAKEVVDYIEEYASNRIKEVLSSYENFKKQSLLANKRIWNGTSFKPGRVLLHFRNGLYFFSQL